MRIVVVASGALAPGDETWLDGADLVIAADGGANALDRLGRRPDRLVGDLDSADPAIVERLESAGTRVDRHPADKEASDTELAVRAALAEGADEVDLLGATGGDRLDHELANLLLFAEPAFAGVHLRAIVGATTIRAARAGPATALHGVPGDLVTLLPIGGDAVRGHDRGAALAAGRGDAADGRLARALERRRRVGRIGPAHRGAPPRRRNRIQWRATMTTTSPDRDRGWRTVDIVVAAVVAVAFGVAFLAWNALAIATTPAFAFLPPAQAILNGLWLLPAVLVGLIVRRPGAAFFGGFVAAAVSVVLGSVYGVDALVSGLVQGAGAELGFALGLYRRWTLPFAMLSGALAGLAATIHDVPIYYRDAGADVWLVYGIASVASGALVAGLGAWLLVRALVRTGVLREFAAGREQRPV